MKFLSIDNTQSFSWYSPQQACLIQRQIEGYFFAERIGSSRFFWGKAFLKMQVTWLVLKLLINLSSKLLQVLVLLPFSQSYLWRRNVLQQSHFQEIIMQDLEYFMMIYCDYVKRKPHNLGIFIWVLFTILTQVKCRSHISSCYLPVLLNFISRAPQKLLSTQISIGSHLQKNIINYLPGRNSTPDVIDFLHHRSSLRMICSFRF